MADGCDDTSSYEHAVLWQNGTATDLGTLGGPQATAAAINNLGQVVGWAQTSADADHGYLWSNGKMTDLGLNFVPAAINDNGVIVGGNQIYSGGTLQDLNTLIPAGSPHQIMYAKAINNNNGQIVAIASYGDHTLLLTPNWPSRLRPTGNRHPPATSRQKGAGHGGFLIKQTGLCPGRPSADTARAGHRPQTARP